MSAIDIAVINALRNDATLAGLAPGGVYQDQAPEAAVNAALEDPDEVFGIVTLQAAPQRYALEATRALEECQYLVKFVTPSTSPVSAQSALDRAETVLGTVTVSGFAISCSRRQERISYVEVDGPVRWQHRAVEWLIVASPTS